VSLSSILDLLIVAVKIRIPSALSQVGRKSYQPVTQRLAWRSSRTVARGRRDGKES